MADAAPAPVKKTPKKASKPKKPASHPKYSEMIAKAIAAKKDRNGTSRKAILVYILANFKVDPKNANSHLKLALRAGLKKGTLVSPKNHTGSFKLGEKPKAAKKPKAKKPKAAKKPAAKKPKKPASHPKYSEMIAKAIAAKKDRNGTSRKAILVYILANFKVDPKNANSHLKLALRAGLKKGTLVSPKNHTGSFKLGEKPKAAKKPKAKKPKAAKKPAAKKKTPKKASKPKKPASHPKYSEMIAKAIAAKKDRNGTSRKAILVYILANFKVDPKNANSHLKLALRAGLKKGTLVSPKNHTGSFKLGEKPKAAKKPKAKKPKAAKKPAAKKKCMQR
ncbi:hypothetical protein KUTeg_021282 [Tegillarca granosa]|uniref:H15 domain-containing protein n=1 Tax=Tegillarca granosa TaxID=220873 RepID=A0ABQ9EFT0_TEGGR|nr:hypothetical protein KUTeg_021282 [Tegillarca granosa]